MVVLICGKQKLETTPEQAQSILYIQKQMHRKGWELDKDSPYEFKDNALIKRADKKDCSGAKRSKGNTGGGTSPGKTPVPRGVGPE